MIDEERIRALITLQALEQRKLTVEQWQGVDKLLHRLKDALEQDHEDAFREALGSLEKYTSLRIRPIGTSTQSLSSPPEHTPEHTYLCLMAIGASTQSLLSPPEHTREHMNLLIHILAPQEENPPPDEQKDAQEPSNNRE